METGVEMAGMSALVEGEAGGRARMLLLVGLALVLSMATWFSATAILAELRRALSLSDVEASWITNAVQLGFVTGAVGLSVTGLADSIESRWLIASCALLAALSNLALLVVPDFTALIVARFVTGLALAGVYPPALKVIAGWFAVGRGFAMGAAVGALTLGSASSFLIRALGGGIDWRAIVVVSSLAALAGAALAFMFIAEGPYAGPRPKFHFGRILSVMRDRPVLLANLGYFGHMWELYAMWAWFYSYALAAGWGASVAAALLTFAVIGVGALGCVCGGLLADRIGRTAATAWMMGVSGLCAILVGAAFDGPGWLFTLIALVWGFSVIGDSAQFSAMISELSDRETIGAALALQTGCGFALTIASIRLVPWLAGEIGWRWSFLLLAPGPLVGVRAMLALRRLPQAKLIANGRR